jgi:hypothetical protein
VVLMKAGDIFRVKYPFVRTEYEEHDADEYGVSVTTVKSWKPGVEFITVGYYGDDTEAVCDAEGEMVLTVIDVHKPGRFPARVFFTRKWVDPDGKAFGKTKLHIMTQQAFQRRTAGYMHEYVLRTSEEATA